MENEQEDYRIPPVRSDQAMHIAAVMVGSFIGTFGKPDDSEETLTSLHLLLLSIFIHQLTTVAKHKDKVAAILRTMADELESLHASV